MSAIANISAALGYDAVELALVNGSLADAMRAAASQYASAPLGEDSAPESCRTVYAASPLPCEFATVRPGKW